ncbi:MAG: tetraacyldisaccharide 4'-kinase [Candidatus Gastranaerophilales bacterium]|nr:tetraacyldisaccharide 4'-kinase [Candidatus Gastranaerophilales bacterium]
MKNLFRKIHYSEPLCGKEKLAALVILPLSVVASLFYGIAVAVRNFLYDKGLLKSAKLPAYVISIGNLTTGGTGKTPITAEIANRLTAAGRRVAVISRGYGGKLDINATNIISDGQTVFHTAEQTGDEPFWIAKNAPGTVVITGKNRVASGRLAIEKYNSDVLLVDDGFQHRKLQRDLDIVLIDGARVLGNRLLLPAGALREPVSNIKRADKVIIVNKTGTINDCIPCIQEELKRKYGIESCVCGFVADKIYDISTGETAKEISSAVAFAGIAQPESFFSLLEAQGIRLAEKKVFPDHYLYRKEDVEALIETAQSTGANSIITTEKDAVKIQPLISNAPTSQISVYALKLKVDLCLDLERCLKLNTKEFEDKTAG